MSTAEFSLLDLLKKEAIAIDVPVSDWKDAVIKVGEILVKIDAAEPKYIEAMIKTVEEMGPYIVITKGIALPHARPEEGAKKPALALIRLQNPINFGNPDNDPVDIIIGFTTTDKRSHVKAIAQLAKFLQKEENIKKMRKAKTVDKLYQHIKEALEKL